MLICVVWRLRDDFITALGLCFGERGEVWALRKKVKLGKENKKNKALTPLGRVFSLSTETQKLSHSVYTLGYFGFYIVFKRETPILFFLLPRLHILLQEAVQRLLPPSVWTDRLIFSHIPS